MHQTASDKGFVARIVIRSSEYEEVGTSIILRKKPLTVLVPSHVCVSIEEGTAQSVCIDSVEYEDFYLLPTPFLEREHLSVLQLDGRRKHDLDAVSIPRKQPQLRSGLRLSCLRKKEQGELSVVSGSLTEVVEKGVETTLVTNLSASPGDSGSPILVGDTLAGICVGMTMVDGKNSAVAVPLSSMLLRELRRIALRTRRVAIALAFAVVLLAFGGLAARSWTSFDLAGVDGPMNTAEDVESPNTITAYNGQIITLRPTWKRTFPTSVRWWVPFSSIVGEKHDRIAIGTRIEEGTPGSLFLLDNLGRVVWSYTVPDGECIFNDETETYNGFYVYRVFVGDITGDRRNEVIASFVHNAWYPCKIVVFNLEGDVLGEYWHPGYLRTFAVGGVGDAEKPMLIMTGSNNRFRPEGSPWNPQGLMAFSSAAIAGQAPPYTGTGAKGNELWYYLLPDVDTDHKSKIDDIVIADSDGNGSTEILAHTDDGRFYYLNEFGEVLRVDLGDDFLKEFGHVDAPELRWVELPAASE